MSILKVLPDCKSLRDIITNSKSQSCWKGEIPNACNEIKFDDFTQILVNKSHRCDTNLRGNILHKTRYICNTTHKQIKDELPTFIKNVLKHPGTCVAGGSIVNIINDMPMNDSDYDVFFYGLNREQVVALINTELQKFKSSQKPIIYMYNNVLNVRLNGDIYQFVLLKYNTPQEIIQRFDIGVCQICITDTDLYVTDMARFCLLNRVIIWDIDQIQYDCYNTRLKKYHESKKFSVIFPELKPCKLTVRNIIYLICMENKNDSLYSAKYSSMYGKLNYKELIKSAINNAKVEIYFNIKGIYNSEESLIEAFAEIMKGKPYAIKLHLEAFSKIIVPVELKYYEPGNHEAILGFFNNCLNYETVRSYQKLPTYSENVYDFVL